MYILLVSLALLINHGYGDVSTEAIEAYQLRTYKTYADMYISQFDMPDDVKFAFWHFSLITKEENCKIKNATVYLQHAGFPLVTPLNETYPQHFQQLEGARPIWIDLSTANSRLKFVTYNMLMPSAGKWFAMAYLNPTNEVEKITPKGTGNDCRYYLATNFGYSSYTPTQMETLNTDISQVLVPSLRIHIKVYIPKNILSYNLTFTKCRALISNTAEPSNNCSFQVDSLHRSRQGTSTVMLCNMTNGNDCTMTFDKADVDFWHHFDIISLFGQELELTSIVITKECPVAPALNECTVSQWNPVTIPGLPYSVYYVLPGIKRIALVDAKAHISSFEVKPLLHSGGTAKVTLNLIKQVVPAEFATIFLCVTHKYIENSKENIKRCSQAIDTDIDYASATVSEHYIPYPRAGVYYVSVAVECYSTADKSHVKPCDNPYNVTMNISISPCVDDHCSNSGKCYMYYTGTIHWSACKCIAGYRGYGCTDSSQALSRSQQLLHTLLLTLSNLLFICSVAMAVYWRWFSEALVYSFVLFASSFYHACDNGTMYALCIFDYSILKYCDFYGSVFAVWVTAMCIAALPSGLRSFFHMAGCLGIVVGTQFSLTGLWVFLAPLIVAAVILILSLVRICVAEKKCYPRARVWLIQYLPGSVCALVGVILYSAVETDDNYYYIHSIWHMLMATSIILLIPRNDKLNVKTIRSCFFTMKNPRRRYNSSDPVVDSNSSVLLEQS